MAEGIEKPELFENSRFVRNCSNRKTRKVNFSQKNVLLDNFYKTTNVPTGKQRLRPSFSDRSSQNEIFHDYFFFNYNKWVFSLWSNAALAKKAPLKNESIMTKFLTKTPTLKSSCLFFMWLIKSNLKNFIKRFWVKTH